MMTQTWGPYRLASIATKIGTMMSAFHPMSKVNITSQKDVSSMFGRKASAILQVSMSATAIPIYAISFIANFLSIQNTGRLMKPAGYKYQLAAS